MAGQFLSGADKYLGEVLFSSLETVEDCEMKVVDYTEELLTATQLRSPVKMLRSPLKVSVCLSVCLSVFVISVLVTNKRNVYIVTYIFLLNNYVAF